MGKRKAEKAEKQDKPKKKKHGFRKLLFLLVIGGVGALALSEGLRNKALDALFGSEEEFQYSPPSAESGDGAGAPSESA
ncbi:MAG TPA: hypothetical protein VHV75_14775 [Solirubrobacteraceae bacterium]|jgi:hypothetical protein|nr:hypothetical protein [Solirubrobacteraceae bacterium]